MNDWGITRFGVAVLVAVVFGVSVGAGWPAPVSATTVAPTWRYTNDNILTLPHEAPATFSQDAWGNFSGYTTSNRSFSQQVIANTLGVRLQKFSIDEAYWYVSDRGIIWADSDLVALSIYLTLG